MMEQRLIDANALKDDLRESYNALKKIYDRLEHNEDRAICGGQLSTFLEAILRVKEAPTVDVVPVVRCKDCLHSRELNKYEKQLYLDDCVGCTYHSVSYHDAVMMGDDFCSYGERR